MQQKTKETLRNPDDLERFIKVTSPSVWAVIAACIGVLIALFIWGVFGSVTTNVSTKGVVVNGHALCFLPAEEAAKVKVGDAAEFNGEAMQVAEVGAVPMSIEEARTELGSDYLSDTMLVGDWGYRIVLSGESASVAQGIPQPVSITVERIAPIKLILRDRG